MTDHSALKETIAALGLTIRADFVPFLASRNATDENKARPDKRSLNWKVTLLKAGVPVFVTDYSAGVAHCPSYKQNSRWTLEYSSKIEWETDTGTTYRNAGFGAVKGKAILPNELDVIYSLVLDADVIDYGTFEDWAGTMGYDTDSRSAETTYRACLEIGLKLRAILGDKNLQALREAFQDY